MSKQIYVPLYSGSSQIRSDESIDTVSDTKDRETIDAQEIEFDKIRQERLAIENSIQTTQEEYKTAQTEIVTDVVHQETLREIHERQEYIDSQERLAIETKNAASDPGNPTMLSKMQE